MNTKNKTRHNVIMAGVGGQGSILASHLLAEAALSDGKDVKLAETYGGATRGGSVLVHIRIGASWSPRTPEDDADVIVAMEPLEALRIAVRYLKPGGRVLLNTRPWYPVDVTAGGMRYPSLENIMDALKSLDARALSLDATELAIRAGNERMANCVMLGGLFALCEIDVTEESLFQAMKNRWPSHLVEVNQRAYQLGYESVTQGMG